VKDFAECGSKQAVVFVQHRRHMGKLQNIDIQLLAGGCSGDAAAVPASQPAIHGHAAIHTLYRKAPKVTECMEVQHVNSTSLYW
jgi:hypothetical protein